MKRVIVPSWPLPGTSFQVNITTVANSNFSPPSGGIVPNRRRVRQCHAASSALLWVMGRREAGLLVIIRRLHLRYAVTHGLVCATRPSSPPRVTLTVCRPFRTILPTVHVRYRDGARVIRYPCLSMFDAFRAFGKQNRPFAVASRPKSYRSRPPP